MQKKLLPTLLSISFIVILWQVVSMQIGFPAIFPSLSDLFVQLFQVLISADFALTVASTVVRTTIGFLLAFIFSFIFSSISAFSSFCKSFLHPIIVITRSIPVISIVLIALLWFAPDNLPVFIALLTMFPILYQNMLTGFESTDKRWIEMAIIHNKTFVQRYFSIYLPASRANIFDGMSTALGFGWRAVIIGEVLAQPLHGIGTAMKEAQAYINVSELISWTVIGVALSYVFEILLRFIKKINLSNPAKIKARFNIYKDTQVTGLKKIVIVNLDKNFNDKNIFDSFSINFNSEIVHCIKSPSGKGKTTLLRLISGLDKDYSGNIKFERKYSFGYAFQDFRLLPWLTVFENIMYAVDRKKNPANQAEDIANYLIVKMELTKEANNYPTELSGGQQQRVSLARALAAKPDVLLLDEPLTGLDNKLKREIIDFLSEWILTYKPLVIWATHENISLKELPVKDYQI